MSDLIIPLNAITERTRPVHARVREDELRPEGVAPVGLGPVTIDGVISSLEPEYLFSGTVSGEFHHPCDRCLEPAAVPLEIDVTLVFEPGEPGDALEDLDEHEVTHDDDEGDSPHYFQNDRIDLRAAIWEEIALASPSKFLCREDCKGLCPQCGANLNTGDCACTENGAPQTGNLGFAGLADMFPDLPDKDDKKS